MSPNIQRCKLKRENKVISKIQRTTISEENKMIPNKKTARLAGFLWLMMVLLGLFAQFLVRDKLIVPDISTTINNIMANEFLFRLGFVSDQLMALCCLFTSLVLYKLLSSINKNMAVLMVILAISGSVISMINLLNVIAPLQLLSNEYYLNVFGVGQVQAQVMLYLDLYEQGYVIAQIFFMTWVLPLGILVYKSRFLPRIFGILFVVETFVGLISTAVNFLSPNAALEMNLLIPAAIAEISFMLWLLIRGINESKVKIGNRLEYFE